jgi:diguanylate cyclase (GGDEF)-like protein
VVPEVCSGYLFCAVVRVVVAHPDPEVRGRFARVLESAGHEPLPAPPDEALAVCRSAAPDVAVADAAGCPRLLGELKRDPDAYATAVVLIEGEGLAAEAAERLLRRGAYDVLVEPVSDGELLLRIAAAKRTRDLQDELTSQSHRLETLVREDPLTGLANRRAILTLLSGMISGARRHGRPLSVAMVDLDHFKRVNDEFGHQAGDAVLVGAVRAMRRRLRQEDQLGRMGGEEFLVLLPDTGMAAARRVADALRRQVALAGGPVPVTASLGLATWEGEAPDELLRRADEALYAAKRSGRNRVHAAPPAPATLLDRT